MSYTSIIFMTFIYMYIYIYICMTVNVICFYVEGIGQNKKCKIIDYCALNISRDYLLQNE